MEFRVLGSLAVQRDGGTLALGGRKHTTLLAALLIHAGRAVSVDTLLDVLWPESPPATGRTLVQQYVAKLRRVLEPDLASGGASTVLHTRGPGYALDLDGHFLDAVRFSELVARARAHRGAGDRAAAVRLYDEAAALWRGPAYAEFVYDDFAAAEVRRLTEERLIATEERLDVELALGRHREVAGELEALVDEHPLRQELWRLRMLALHRTGRQPEALAAYRHVRDLLVNDHGVEPGARLDAMHSAILRQDPQLDAPVTTSRRGNLAPTLSSFVGRRGDRRDVVGLLRGHRLVTLVGLSGVGKTRVAIEVAAQLRDELPGGVWVVELDQISGQTEVWQAIGRAVGAEDRPGADTAAAVTDHIGSAATLVVLDACEQAVAAVGVVVRRLVAHCGDLRVLATSRTPLGVNGEIRYAVAALPTPERDASDDELASSAAVQLFVDRVHEVDQHVDLSGRLSTVADICRQLDGLPLAVELAAARLRALSLDQLAARLDQRFELLVDPRAGEQRSLRDIVEWTVSQLDVRERTLFAKLAVFAGGFTLDAANSLAGRDALDPLSRLVDQSVVTVRRRPDQGVRYVMLETLRAYAGDLLGDERSRAASAHRAWFSRQAAIHAGRLRGTDPVTALAWFGDEHDNLDAAQRSAVDAADADTALQLATDCQLYLQMRGRHTQALGWLTRALECHTGPPTPLTTAALAAAGSVERERARFSHARRLLGAALRQARQTGDDMAVADITLRLAWPTQDEGNLDEAARLASEALPVLRRGDLGLLIAQCLLLLAQIDRRRGRMGRKDPLSEEANRIAEDADSLWMRGWARLSLALSSHAGGDLDAAERHARAAYDLMQPLGFPRGQMWSLSVLATAAFARDDTQRALLLLGATEAMRRRAPAPIPGAHNAELDAQLAQIRALLESPALTVWYGRGLTLGALEIAATI